MTNPSALPSSGAEAGRALSSKRQRAPINFAIPAGVTAFQRPRAGSSRYPRRGESFHLEEKHNDHRHVHT